jgi:ABC transporter, permease protein
MKPEKNRNFIATIIASIIAIFVLFPFFLVVINSAKSSTDIVISPINLPKNWGQMLDNMKNVINNANFNYWSSFKSSLIITVVSLALLTVFSCMAAWVLSRNEKKKWSAVIFLMFVAAMVIPFQVVMLPILTIFKTIGNSLGIPMLSSYTGIIFAYLGFGGSMSIFIFHGFVKGIPKELEEAAKIDGCKHEQIFFKIIFPLMKPVQMTVLILNGLWIWNDYLLPSIMLGLNGRIKTLPIAVSSFVGSYVKQWDLILTAAFLAMIPIIILFLVAQKQIIKGMMEGAIK